MESPSTTRDDSTLHAIDQTMLAADAYGRADLVQRLARTRERVTDASIRVMVVGEFKKGKSSLVNALLNAPVCPVDDDVATAVPTFVRYAAEPVARLIHEPEDEGEPRTEDIPIDRLAAFVTESANPENQQRVRAAEVGIPRSILADGLTIIDTPGVGGLGSTHTAATLAALPQADAIVFVSDASQEYGRPEVDFLQIALKTCPVAVFVLTKVDFYPEWKRIKDIDGEHLRAIGIDAEILPTSSALRERAIRTNDKILNGESGYPELVEFLRSEVIATASRRAQTDVYHHLNEVVTQLDDSFKGELKALEDPEQIGRITAEFEETKRRTDELRSNAARWQVTLNDGVADLTADFDHRLRGRMRVTLREAEEALDAGDPAAIWEEFEPWLKQRVAHDLAETYLELDHRTTELSTEVARHFEDGRDSAGVRLDVTAATEKVGDLGLRTRIERKDKGVMSTGLTAMRGSYGGFLMFGMVGRMAGLAMANPATAVLALLMGGKAVKDERERQLTIRRQQAKAASRQFIDDASFEVGKLMRDELRRVQRVLRDHYTERAEELNRSVSRTLAAAKSAAQSNQAQREERLRTVTAERARLAKLGNLIGRLAPRTETPA